MSGFNPRVYTGERREERWMGTQHAVSALPVKCGPGDLGRAAFSCAIAPLCPPSPRQHTRKAHAGGINAAQRGGRKGRTIARGAFRSREEKSC